MDVLVSIITSVYNCDSYIDEMISSIMEQSFSDWELIIVDDASTDGTLESIQKYSDSRIVILRNQQNEGLTRNLNKAIRRARGKYLVRMDGDDIAFSQRLERQIDYMEQHSDVVLSGGAMKAFGNASLICQRETEEEKLRVQMLFDAVICHPTFIIRKKALEVNNIMYDESLQYAQDYDLTFRLSKVGRIANVSELLVKYRVHDSQISVDKRDKQIACANRTRKKILKELDVVLTDLEFKVWESFCLLRYKKISEKEEKLLEEICQRILKKNKVKEIYNSKILQDTLLGRMKAYVLECNNFDSEKEQKLNDREKYHALFRMMCTWMQKEKSGYSVEEYLKKNQYKEIAIYGMSDVGKILLEELKKSEIRVAYVIDKNPAVLCDDTTLKVLHPQELLPEVDVVIVTAISYVDEIRKQIAKKVMCPIVSLEDIVCEM